MSLSKINSNFVVVPPSALNGLTSIKFIFVVCCALILPT